MDSSYMTNIKRIAIGNCSTDPNALDFKFDDFIQNAFWIQTSEETVESERIDEFDTNGENVIYILASRSKLSRSIRQCTHCLEFIMVQTDANIITCSNDEPYVCNGCIENDAEKIDFVFADEQCSHCEKSTSREYGCYEPWAEYCGAEGIYRFTCNDCKLHFYWYMFERIWREYEYLWRELERMRTELAYGNLQIVKIK